MDKVDFVRADLILHLIGMTTLAGSLLSSFVLFCPFVKSSQLELEKSLMMLQLQKKLSRLMAAGLGIQVASGILLVTAAGGGYGAQLWFKIKMGLVVFLLLGSVFLGRVLQARLYNHLLIKGASVKVEEFRRTIRNICAVQLLLLSFILLIFIVSVFRFQ